MKKILCYGDSNTYGYNPIDGSRFSKEIRWTGILQKNLENTYEILEEGACDRTGFVYNPKGFLFCANRHFAPMIEQIKNENIEIIILALGTNDLQFQYNIENDTIETGLKNLINNAKKITDNIILIQPVELNEDVLKGYFNYQFDETSIKKSQKVGEIYTKITKECNCREIPINKFVQPSSIDGLHYDEQAHYTIAQIITQHVMNNL